MLHLIHVTVPNYRPSIDKQIVISNFLERHSKAKRRTLAYSRAKRRIKGVVMVS